MTEKDACAHVTGAFVWKETSQTRAESSKCTAELSRQHVKPPGVNRF